MIGIKNDGSNPSIDTISCNSIEVINEQPRQFQPRVFFNGREVTIVDQPQQPQQAQSHCSTYKNVYAVWGIGTAIGFAIGLVAGVPYGALESVNVGAGIMVGSATCGAAVASCIASRIAQRIIKDQVADTATKGPVLEFDDYASPFIQDTEVIINPFVPEKNEVPEEVKK